MASFASRGDLKEGHCLWCGLKLRHRYATKKEYTGEYRPPSRCTNCPRIGDDLYGEHPKAPRHEWALIVGPEAHRLKEVTDSDFFLHKPCGEVSEGKMVQRVKSRERYTERPGYDQSGYFCTLRCGFDFACWHAEKGHRLRKVGE